MSAVGELTLTGRYGATNLRTRRLPNAGHVGVVAVGQQSRGMTLAWGTYRAPLPLVAVTV